MGQQQILLIVLSVILVGISITVGISMFGSYSLTANKDAIVLDIINLSMAAHQHRFRPLSMAGGAGKFTGFEVPSGMESNANASYVVTVVVENDLIKIVATSNIYSDATITAIYNKDLELVKEDNAVAGSSQEGFIFEGWEK